jgi:flagellar biosynthesis/type III secretory pathway chaperone
MPEPRSVSEGRGHALALLQQLLESLDQEFEALKRRDLGYFERLQPTKEQLLAQLSAWQTEPERAAATFVHDTECRDWLLRCRDAHRRNETLLQRHLEAVRGALQALSAGTPLQGVEIYDRLGQMRGRGAGRGIAEA